MAFVLLCIAVVIVSLGLTAVASTTLWWMLHAWRGAAALRSTGFAPPRSSEPRSFSLLVPARHEEQVLGHTLDRLAELDHPAFEVIAIVGDDDPGTAGVAREAQQRHPDLISVVVDEHPVKSKPKAMNTALPHCRGEIVGVFDAEDDVHPRLLRSVDATFAQSRADVVQGGVQLMNLHSSWWAVHNCLEYWFWFRSRLHFHADQRFIPLGGNTVFIRTSVLERAGGWDGECLAEDCELGVRLSSTGSRVAVSYDPELVTREETPGTVGSLVRQRTRWNQGFLQVFRKGEWRRLPSRRQRMLARYTLAMPFLQAATGALVPVSAVLMFALKVPVLVALVALLPLIPTAVTVAVQVAAVGDFARCFHEKARLRDHLRIVLGAIPYQLLLTVAAVRAVVREWSGATGWEKTEHAGTHLTAVAPVAMADGEAA
ncbi:MAG TPA: glycosyltransferase [Nocardioides sp.]|nr:glycosyltransferase [Nocardioides sp.]